jgi:hypothetical protein
MDRQLSTAIAGPHGRQPPAYRWKNLLPRPRWSVFLVQPETLLGWRRCLVRRRWTYPSVRMGRPPLADDLQQLIVLMPG